MTGERRDHHLRTMALDAMPAVENKRLPEPK
jgi:hypothetical protein